MGEEIGSNHTSRGLILRRSLARPLVPHIMAGGIDLGHFQQRLIHLMDFFSPQQSRDSAHISKGKATWMGFIGEDFPY